MTRTIIVGVIFVVLSTAYTALEAQPSDSLMVHLEFEGDILDSSGNGYDGTATPLGTPSFVPGIIGMAASFAGGQSILFQNFPDSNFSTSNFSLTYWFNTPVDRAAAYVAKHNGCSVARSFDNRQLPSGELLFRISNAQENFDVTTTRTAGWHHFAGVRDDASLLLYLDGVLRDQLAIPPGMNIQVPSDFGISRSPCIGTGDAVSLIGEMDDFRVYERALTSEEVAAAFNVLFADGFEDNLSP